MKAAFLQFAPAYLQVGANLDDVERLLAGADADLLVLPELFATGYLFASPGDLAQVAEPIPNGRTTAALERWAARTGAVLVAGVPEREGGCYYNTAVVATPNGYAGKYRKVHLYDEEKRLFAPGDLGFPVFGVRDREGAAYRLGVMICYDWRFPEAARTLTLKGADILAHPCNLDPSECPRAMPVRAIENHVFTVTANRWGTEARGDRRLLFIGQSLICDPAGTILASAGAAETCLRGAEVDPLGARDRRVTAHNDLFGDRRPEQYELG